MNEERQPGQNGDNPTENVSPVSVSEPLRTAPQEPETERKLDKVEREVTSFERSSLRWTRATFVILAATCIFIASQWVEMRRGTVDTGNLARAAKTQAANMGKMSTAANQISGAAQNMVAQEQRIADNAERSLSASNARSRLALNNTIEEFRLEHRAWVSLSEIGFLKMGADGRGAPIQVNQMRAGDNIGINLSYKNTGSTPAFDVRAGARLDTFPVGSASFKPLPPLTATFGVLQPGGAMFQSMGFKSLTRTNVHDFSSGAVHIYGRVDYWDAFKMRHWSTFCRLILPNGAQAECPEEPDKADTNPN